MRQARALLVLLGGIWLAFVVFSQTGLAGRMADAVALWLFGPRPEGPEELLRYLLQKGYHVGLFGVLGYLAAATGKRGVKQMLFWTVVFSAASEALQFLAPARSPQISDAILNVAAALAGWWLARKLQARA